MICIFVLLCLSLTVSFRTTFKRINTRHESTKIFYERLIDPVEVGTSSDIKQIDLLYDSECPICAMEVEFLQKRDPMLKIKYTDLQSMDYNPALHGNVKFSDGMRKIRAVLPDGNVVTGVEVFRQVYRAIGLGWMFELTSMPVIGTIADTMYDLWAENRLRLTGRGAMADILVERAEKIRQAEPIEDCDLDACALDFGDDE